MGADCEIKFDNNPGKIFYAGQQVTGVVNINVQDVVIVTKLVLLVEGRGECEWSESTQVRDSTGKSRTENINYRGNDEYINTTVHLVPNQTEIQPGQHTYNFMFEVPEEVPSSVQERNGKIYYKVRVRGRSNNQRKFNLEVKSDIAVICPVILEPASRVALQQEEVRQYCSYVFCVSKPVRLSASIPKIVYDVGHRIPINIAINNTSYIAINDVELTLVKYVIYSSDLPCINFKDGEFEIRRMHHGSSFSRCKKEYNVEMEVPYTVPSTHNALVKVMDISYKLHIKAKTSGMHESLKVSFPIIIGMAGQQSFVSATTENEQTDDVTARLHALMKNTFEPSAPSDPDIPSSIEEAMQLSSQSMNTETSSPYSIGRPIGFVIPPQDAE